VLRKLLLLSLYLIVPALVTVVVYRQLHLIFLDPADPSATTVELFDLPEHARLRDVATALEQRGLLRTKWSIRIIAKLRGEEGAIKAGEYELSAAMPPTAILEKFVAGKTLLRRITLREGEGMAVLGPALLQEGIITSVAEFEAALRDPELLREFGITGANFEGYLFPETYQFSRNTPPKKIIRAMYEQFQSRWPAEWEKRLEQLALTKHQVVTLASIIEKESGNTSEQPLIASVFHNRLERKMRLQADPTVIYGIPNFSGNITKDHLTTPTPYNTYVIPGLPPGPIGNPGSSALKAALYPAVTDFLYFVANGAGSHVFSETLDAHNSSVQTYQLKRAP
jgi:UPF0755 protein